jgi:hypothetical protein
MFNLRHLLIFVAGALFFATMTHVLLPYFIQLPITVNDVTVTSTLNNWSIAVNALITLGLLWWAYRAGE